MFRLEERFGRDLGRPGIGPTRRTGTECRSRSRVTLGGVQGGIRGQRLLY